jgi:hypothetical protein
MRKDFKKLLCECYRHKGYGDPWYYEKHNKGRTQKHAKGDYDEWSHPKYEAMSMGRGTKQFGENLKPLVKYLRKCVGRKWDDVYSEIREVCPPHGAVNEHIYTHLWQYVERKPYFVDGVVCRSPEEWHGSRYELLDHGGDNTFYIDQEGYLRRAPKTETYRQRQKRKRKEAQENSDVRVLDGVYFVRKDNVWYGTKLVPLPKPYSRVEEKESKWRGKYQVTNWYYPSFHDRFLRVGRSSGPVKEDDANLCIKKYGKKVYCTQLTQLSTKKLRKLGLKE